MFTRTVWLVLRKDLTVEVRSLEIALTTIFFAVSAVLVFAFALVQEGRAPEDGAAGILWIAIAFAGTLALGRTFERERQSETLRALLLAPAPRPAVYIGKLLGILAILAATEALVLPLVAFLFLAPFFVHPFWLAGVLLAGTLGFASVGTLFAAMLVRAQPGCPAAGAVVSDHGSGHHCRSSRDGSAPPTGRGPGDRSLLGRAAHQLRRRLPDAGAVDVRTAHDRLNGEHMSFTRLGSHSSVRVQVQVRLTFVSPCRTSNENTNEALRTENGER